jgi:site-specific DNA-methyltransferase (cytosine-N4-specific)
MKPFYTTAKGEFFLGDSKNILEMESFAKYRDKVRLIFTSPPFPLNRKKKYGNLEGKKYAEWLSDFSFVFSEFITKDGSIVLEIGNAWNKGIPTYSTLPLESLIMFKEKANLHLCQEFIYFNPARLPTPIQWVNKERIRVKDAFTRLWWLSTTPRPYANNMNILDEYSESMIKLLEKKKYNYGKRPSEHKIGEKSFLKDNKGSIPPNVIIASNTKSKSPYLTYCKNNDIAPHPSRMPEDIAAFFIKFLTKEDDIVLDPFGGSNTTGATAEKLNRRWITIETDEDYAKGSLGHFIFN